MIPAAYLNGVERFHNRAHRRLVEVVRLLGVKLHTNAASRTPFDTGRAMSSWNITPGDRPDTAITPLLRDRTNPVTGAVVETAARGASPLTQEQAMSVALRRHEEVANMTMPVLTVSNHVPYIQQLEDGSSQQSAPGQMWQQSKDDLKSHFNNIVQQAKANING